jgi:hypothetical protein
LPINSSDDNSRRRGANLVERAGRFSFHLHTLTLLPKGSGMSFRACSIILTLLLLPALLPAAETADQQFERMAA